MARRSADDGLLDWLPGLLEQARWFAGKGRDGRVVDVRLLTTWVDSYEPLRSWAVLVEYPDGSTEHYHVLAEHTAEGPREPSETGWQDLWTAVAADLRGTSRLDEEVPGWADLPVRVLTGEQSNTSLLIGDALIVKIFRTLERGRSVESEMADLLDGQAMVARNYTTVGIDPGDPRIGPVDLLTVFEQFPTAEDGWELATSRAEQQADFTDEAHTLGVTLRRVHRTLAERAKTAIMPGATITAAMIRRLDAAVDEVPELAPFVPDLRQVFEALADHTLTVQRVHGDFHLGQCLRVAPNAWRIIDFAGEPLKSARERRAPDSPQRDLAGMLRSFCYAGRVGQTRAAPSPAGSAWTLACREAFVSGYRTGDSSPTASERAALRAYELDKAVYDVIYETRNRPTWLPLALGTLNDSLQM
ncbi:phosphotransferase [Enemella sp. A6]|uniref:phosphotransferase n=1 Tax=Enemella sp. A6 TaxID=3440152 RepID=UPI003EBF78F1